MFQQLVRKIKEFSSIDFRSATDEIGKYIDEIPEKEFKEIVKQIGTIPENIEHDSTEEKLYSKASDIVLARCFRLLGLASKVLAERADSADILAESISGYNYSLVADAKCFRLSRTAKNQKDFKVSNLSDWRGSENDYAVLVAPYFQYPQAISQIYSKALDNNVCLLSWEQISILLEKHIKETAVLSMESLWRASEMISRDKSLSFANAKCCLLPKMDVYVAKKIGISEADYREMLNGYKKSILDRGKIEIAYWTDYIEEIREYSREKAVEELIKAKKLREKINAISQYIEKLNR